ncbi:MAG TPA: hypothetical protein VKD72_04830 [Gemmataceae bacterium]|nr:hypothetical protein [Gemmataceae bacterium]
MPKPRPGPNPSPANTATERRRRLKALHARLDAERATLARWMTRLKRAFHFVEKSQARAGRLEREIARLEAA